MKLSLLKTVALVAWCAGCRAEPVTATATPVPSPVTPTVPMWTPSVVDVTSISATVEVLSPDTTLSAVPLGPVATVAIQDDVLVRIGPTGVEETWGFGLTDVRAAESWGAGTLLATETGLVVYDNGLVPTALDDLVDGVDALLGVRSGLWMHSSSGLSVVRDGELLDVRVGDARAVGFARGTAGAAPAIWTFAGQEAVALNFVSDVLTPFESQPLFGAPDQVAATVQGDVVLTIDGWIAHRSPDGVWSRLDLGEGVQEVLGHAGGDVVWARTDSRWLVLGANGWSSTDVPIDARGTVDSIGRLVTSGSEGVVRYAIGLPLVLDGVPTDNIVTPTRVRVVATSPERDPLLSATASGLDGAEVVLTVEDGWIELDPEQLAPGPWTMSVTANYGIESSSTSASIEVGPALEPTWPDDIFPIYLESCTPCHEPGQGNLALDNELNWVTTLDVGTREGSAGILDRVAIDNMPTDTALSESDKFILTTWAEGLQP